jgi:hypothetical protein
MIGVGLEWVLFAILGIMAFVTPVNPNTRQFLMILFAILMILWLVGIGVSASGGMGQGWHLFGGSR